MDWHCQDISGAPYSDYFSVGNYINNFSLPPINNLEDAIAFCQVQGYETAQVLQVGDQTLTAIIQQALEIPSQAQLEQMWMLGLVPPIICYLTAWGYQTVIAWFDHRDEN